MNILMRKMLENQKTITTAYTNPSKIPSIVRLDVLPSYNCCPRCREVAFASEWPDVSVNAVEDLGIIVEVGVVGIKAHLRFTRRKSGQIHARPVRSEKSGIFLRLQGADVVRPVLHVLVSEANEAIWTNLQIKSKEGKNNKPMHTPSWLSRI